MIRLKDIVYKRKCSKCVVRIVADVIHFINYGIERQIKNLMGMWGKGDPISMRVSINKYMQGSISLIVWYRPRDILLLWLCDQIIKYEVWWRILHGFDL